MTREERRASAGIWLAWGGAPCAFLWGMRGDWLLMAGFIMMVITGLLFAVRPSLKPAWRVVCVVLVIAPFLLDLLLRF